MKILKTIPTALLAIFAPMTIAATGVQDSFVSLSGLIGFGGELRMGDTLILSDSYTTSDGAIEKGAFYQNSPVSPYPVQYWVRHLNPSRASFAVTDIKINFATESQAVAFADEKAKEIKEKIKKPIYPESRPGNYYSEIYNIYVWENSVHINIHNDIVSRIEYDALLKRKKLNLQLGNISIANDTFNSVKKKFNKTKGCHYEIEKDEFGSTVLKTKGVCFGFDDEADGLVNFNGQRIAMAFVTINNAEKWEKEFFNELKRKYPKHRVGDSKYTYATFHVVDDLEVYKTALNWKPEMDDAPITYTLDPGYKDRSQLIVRCDASVAMGFNELYETERQNRLKKLEKEYKKNNTPSKALQGKL